MQRVLVLVASMAATLVLAASATAHPEHLGPATNVFGLDPGMTPFGFTANKQQHPEEGGHLPPVQRNVELVGKLDLFPEDEQPGRIADVASFGNYAYLGAFAAPNCEDPGVYVVDMSDPSAPREVDFIPTSDPSSFPGEGIQVLNMNTEFFQGPLLIYNNETCAPHGGAVLGPDPRLGLAGPGGATLVDVRDPLNWRKLADHVGDMDPPPPGGLAFGLPHNSHSAFAWQQGEKAYMVTVDNGEGGVSDIDIHDITNPSAPEEVVETGMADWPQAAETPAPNGNNAFLHDMVVKQVGDRYLMLASYWDGGYVVLDVTNLPEKPTFLGHTDFGAVEPFAGEMGLAKDWTPEGNAHQGEFNYDNTMFLGADEDFDAKRVTGKITSGQYADTSFSASNGNATPPVDDENPIVGGTRYVGNGCSAVPPATADRKTALAERGPGNTCPFAVKVQAVKAAGYTSLIVFNDKAATPNCEAIPNPLAVGDIPMVAVARSTGLKLMNMTFGDPCTTDSPPAGQVTPLGEGVHMTAFYDGWGYMHLYDAQTMETLDHWALPESLDAEAAEGKGDLSIHEVAMDPNRNRAYVSHYAGGFRVFDFSREGGIEEVGAFIAEGGSNLWGVEIHPPTAADENPLVLASDRDSGLWLFRYSPPETTGGSDGGSAAPGGDAQGSDAPGGDAPGGDGAGGNGGEPGAAPPAAARPGDTTTQANRRARKAHGARLAVRKRVRRGRIVVRLACPQAEANGCAGRVVLRARGRAVAQRRYRLKAGATRVIRLRLADAQAERRLARGRAVRVTVVAKDGEGPKTRRRARVR